MKSVLFVCTANICRSPMAVALFNALAEDQGLDAIARSAGVAALTGEPTAPYARQVMEELGVGVGNHRARQVDQAMLQASAIALTMTPYHRDLLHREFGGLSEKIQTLPEYAEGDAGASIADPYGHHLGAYRASARELLRFVELVVWRLKREQTEAG